MDFSTGEWNADTKVEFTYENGYPVTIDTFYFDLDEHFVETQEYTFDGDLPAAMEHYDEYGEHDSTTEYLRGMPYEFRRTSSDGLTKERVLYQFANGDAYFTLLLSSRVSAAPNDREDGFSMEEVDSIAVTTKNGLLEKTVNTGMYANWNDGDEKEWMRFNGTYTANYDADGIISSTSAVFRTGDDGSEDLFELTRENGLITEVVYSVRYPGQDPMPMNRFTFEYSGVETDAASYAAMINSVVIDNNNNFYKYFWY